MRAPDHLLVRTQADGERLRMLGEKRAERVLVCLPAMLELPVLRRPQGQREPGRLAEYALVAAEQLRTPQRADQVLLRLVLRCGSAGVRRVGDLQMRKL